MIINCPTVTGNAVLLLGHLAAGLNAASPYKLVEVDATNSEVTVENRENGNRYMVRVRQVSGQE